MVRHLVVCFLRRCVDVSRSRVTTGSHRQCGCNCRGRRSPAAHRRAPGSTGATVDCGGGLTVFCSKCGRRTVGAEFFCRSCGAALPLGGPPTASVPAVAVEPSRLVSHAPVRVAPIRGPLLVIRRGRSAGSWFRLVAGATRIGRHPDADIFLDDITVSRRHALVTVDGSDVVFADLGSVNGSYVNGVRCEAERVLLHGDRLRIGLFELVYFAASGDVGAAVAPRTGPSGAPEPEAAAATDRPTSHRADRADRA